MRHARARPAVRGATVSSTGRMRVHLIVTCSAPPLRALARPCAVGWSPLANWQSVHCALLSLMTQADRWRRCRFDSVLDAGSASGCCAAVQASGASLFFPPLAGADAFVRLAADADVAPLQRSQINEASRLLLSRHQHGACTCTSPRHPRRGSPRPPPMASDEHEHPLAPTPPRRAPPHRPLRLR